MASVTPDRVRDRVNLSSADIPDSKVTEFIKDAEAEIAPSTNLRIIKVNGQERIRAAVWLENSLRYLTQSPVEACLT